MTLRTHPAVSKRFVHLIARIQPLPAEVATAQRHIGRIRQRLTQDLSVASIRRIGSHAKRTAIRRHSDVDLLAVLRREAARWGGRLVNSRTLLENARQSLQRSFWNSKMRRDGQAIVVQFEQGRHAVDVVPAIFERAVSGGVAFAIPDGLGDWLTTAPALHAQYLKKVDARSGGRLRKLVQLVKWWAKSRSPAVPIGSFFIESVLIAKDLCVAPASFSRLLALAFGSLGEACNREALDPTAIAQPVRAADTGPKLERVRDSLAHAFDHAMRALRAEDHGDWEEAVRQWGVVFNHKFPRRLASHTVRDDPPDLFA